MLQRNSFSVKTVASAEMPCIYGTMLLALVRSYCTWALFVYFPSWQLCRRNSGDFPCIYKTQRGGYTPLQSDEKYCSWKIELTLLLFLHISFDYNVAYSDYFKLFFAYLFLVDLHLIKGKGSPVPFAGHLVNGYNVEFEILQFLFDKVRGTLIR